MEKSVIICYLLFYLGVLLTFSDSFASAAEKIKARNKVKRGISGKERKGPGIKILDKVNKTVSDMIILSKGKSFKNEDVTNFYVASFSIFLAAVVTGAITINIKLAIALGIAAGFIPFLRLRSGLEKNRNEASREGEILITELLNNYKIHDENMKEAILITANTLPVNEAKHSREMLGQLAYMLISAEDHEKEREAIQRFSFGINTTWAVTLAVNMEFAVIDNRRVTGALEDLIQAIIKARKILEETKRQGNEGMKMLKIMVPLIYFLTITAAIFFFDMTPAQFYHNQFQTDAGALLFLLIVISYLITLIVSGYMGRGKMDL